MLTGLVQSVSQLYAVRFLLGLAEAGYFPGIALYLTYWFRQRDQAQAIALFLTGIPVTSILGAPVSGFILDHAHWLSISSWRWLLILEGIPAVICGVLTYFLLPNRPAEAKFLNQGEKNWITAELAREEREKLASHKISALQALTNKRPRHLQRLWPFLLAPRRFPHGICGGLRDCRSEFGCESRRICRTVCDWLDKGADRQLVRWPGGCRRFLVRISDTDVATSKRSTRQPE